MAAPTIVQRATGTGTQDATATLGQTAIAGNLLLAVGYANGTQTPGASFGIVDSPGFTLFDVIDFHTEGGLGLNLLIAGKIAVGNETHVILGTDTATTARVAATELQAGSLPWDDVAAAIVAADVVQQTAITVDSPLITTDRESYLLAAVGTAATEFINTISNHPSGDAATWTGQASIARLFTADAAEDAGDYGCRFTFFDNAVAVLGTVAVATNEPPPPPPPPESIRIETELPPDEPSVYLHAPDGSEIRVASDEIDRPLTDVAYSSTLPGGHATADIDVQFLLPSALRARKYTPLTVRGPDGGDLWTGRLDSTPQRPAAGTARLAGIGHQALFKDAAGIVWMGVVSDLTQWEEPPSAREELQSAAGNSLNTSFTVNIADGALRIQMDADRNVPTDNIGEVWFLRCPAGQTLDEVQYIASQIDGTNMDPLLRSTSALDGNPSSDHGFTSGLALTKVAIDNRYTFFRDKTNAASTSKQARTVRIHRVSLFADHGLPRRAMRDPTVPDGLYPTAALEHLVRLYTPLDVEIVPSTIALPDLAWLDPTDLGAILEELIAYERDRDWGVWGTTLHYGPRAEMGRVWTARRSEGAEFVDLDQAADPEYNTVIGIYTRTDGQPRRATPLGGGGDVEDSALRDNDPDNPINASNMMGDRPLIVEIPDPVDDDKAMEIFTSSLAEALRPRFAGQVQLPRYAEVDGVMRPTTEVRADDWVQDGDRTDSSPMPLVEAAYQRSSERPCAVTVDQPDNTLAVALARMGAHPARFKRKRIRKKLAKRRGKLKAARLHKTTSAGPGGGTGKGTR